MKHSILKLLITVILLITPLTVCAQGSENSASGLSGNLQGGAYFLQTNSQLYAENTNRRTDTLDGPADLHDEIAGLASIFLRYQFEGGMAVYAGNPLEVGEDVLLAAGVSRPMVNSTLDMALTWLPAGEVWKNPYQAADSRTKTDAETYGLRVELQEIAGSSWKVAYNIGRITIEDDEIGELEGDLKRSGWTHEMGATYTLSLRESVSLSPELSYTYGDIEGLSNRYHDIKIGAQLKYLKPPWVLAGLVSGFHRQYQKAHPLFDKTRQESGIFTFAQAMRLNLFGVEQLFASVGAGYVWSDATIDFYDSRTVIGLAAVGINF